MGGAAGGWVTEPGLGWIQGVYRPLRCGSCSASCWLSAVSTAPRGPSASLGWQELGAVGDRCGPSPGMQGPRRWVSSRVLGRHRGWEYLTLDLQSPCLGQCACWAHPLAPLGALGLILQGQAVDRCPGRE